MMMAAHKPRLTSAEIANLWNIYMIEGLSIPMKTPLIRTCQDKDIRSVTQMALEMSQRYIKDIQHIYQKENHPIPEAFSDKDMNLEAPALFTDSYILHYIYGMAKLGLRTIPQAIGESARQDVLDFLYKAYLEYKDLYQMSLTLLLSKGIYARAASIPIPEKVEFIQKERYFAGWFGKQRPLNASEIRVLHFTIEQNAMSKTLLTGFSQVTKDQEVRDQFIKGIQMANEIIKDLENTLLIENINAIPTIDNEVLLSDISPYSDKLMLAHVAQMGAGAISIYGTYLSFVYRHDLEVKYAGMIKDGLKYSGDGIDLMVERGWLEQPPTFAEPLDNNAKS